MRCSRCSTVVRTSAQAALVALATARCSCSPMRVGEALQRRVLRLARRLRQLRQRLRGRLQRLADLLLHRRELGAEGIDLLVLRACHVALLRQQRLLEQRQRLRQLLARAACAAPAPRCAARGQPARRPRARPAGARRRCAATAARRAAGGSAPPAPRGSIRAWFDCDSGPFRHALQTWRRRSIVGAARATATVRRPHDKTDERQTMVTLNVNGKTKTVDAEADTPLLWVLRENLQLTGTKFGCGMALCGACTVHLDGKPVRSCSTPISAAAPARRSPRSRAWAPRAPARRCRRPGSKHRRAAVRLLPVGPDHERLRAAGARRRPRATARSTPP